MPTETDKPTTVVATGPAAASTDTRDEEIAKLKKQVEDLQNKLLASPKAKAPPAPTGDYCVLGGKTYQVEKTVTCRFATDEGRKGHIDLDSELVVLKR